MREMLLLNACNQKFTFNNMYLWDLPKDQMTFHMIDYTALTLLIACGNYFNYFYTKVLRDL